MKKMKVLSLLFSLALPLVFCEHGSSQTKTTDGFEKFYLKFRATVNKRDRAALKESMPAKFQWAMDGLVSRDEALRNIDKIIGWENFWQSTQKAAAKKASPCKPPYCERRPGYHTSAQSPFPIELMFEQGAEGKWGWTAVLGD